MVLTRIMRKIAKDIAEVNAPSGAAAKGGFAGTPRKSSRKNLSADSFKNLKKQPVPKTTFTVGTRG